MKDFIKDKDGERSEWARSYFQNQKERIDDDFKFVKESFSPASEVTEIGAVPYLFTEYLSNHFRFVKALDIDNSREPRPENDNITFHDVDIDGYHQFPYTDHVICMEVFEHLRFPSRFLESLYKNTPRQVTVIISTPNLYRVNNIWKFLRGNGLCFATPEDFWEGKILGHSKHVREYSVEEMQRFLSQHGFNVVHYRFLYKEDRRGIVNMVKNWNPRFCDRIIYVCMKD